MIPLRVLVCTALFGVLFMTSCTRSQKIDNIVHNAQNLSVQSERGPIQFVVEIADTDEKRAQGLMMRKELKERHGMLFIFESNEDHPFWMKNTLIPLDIIFLDATFKVVGIIENAQPLDESSLSIHKNSLYALEVVAGTVKKYGIKESNEIRLNLGKNS